MCNLYSAYSTQATMRKTFGVARDNAGNLPPLPGIFPDQMAPIVRLADGERELLQMRWGFPPPPKVVRGTKADPVEGEHLLYSFLTTEPNSVVKPVHPKAMPVILTTPEEFETWLSAPVEEALKLQRPLPDDALEIVAEGHRSDQPEAA
jgi:putative SOS response-associated peptidase YedK